MEDSYLNKDQVLAYNQIFDPTTNTWVYNFIEDGLFLVTRLDYDSSRNITYVGKNFLVDANINSTDWRIWKYTYESGVSNLVLMQGPLLGAWGNKTELNW